MAYLTSTLWPTSAFRGSGHFQSVTSSTYGTKEQEWQTFHYCPAIVPKGEINYKNTTNSKDNSNVLHCVRTRGLFFFLPLSRVSWPVQHHLGAICSPSQIPLPFGIGFTWLIHTVNGLSFQWRKKKKERDSMWNCLRSHEVLDLSGTSLSAINLPTVRMSSLCGSTEGSWRGGSEGQTLRQRNNMQVM